MRWRDAARRRRHQGDDHRGSFTNNRGADGGALCVLDGAEVELIDSTLQSNAAFGPGGDYNGTGALYVGAGSTATVWHDGARE